MSTHVAVIDYGMGNIWSVQNGLAAVGSDSSIVASPEQVAAFDKIILPGVGAFEDAMKLLCTTGLGAALTEAFQRGVPILGVCLGMQLMCKSSLEDGLHEGLGWIDAAVVLLQGGAHVKVPHMGWNSVAFTRSSALIEGIADKTDFYFVHSYRVACHHAADVLGTSEHGQTFPAMLARENLYAAQFHPEKSQRAGLKLLENFVRL